MGKVSQVQNGDSGLVARTAYNDAMQTVEVDATITGDGTTATPLSAVQQDISGIATNAADIATNVTGITTNQGNITNNTTALDGVQLDGTSAGDKYLANDGTYKTVVGGVTSVNGETGAVVLDGTEIELIESGGVTITGAISDLQNTDLQAVTDNGNITTNPMVTPSINGAAITAAGSGGTLYLDDAGNYSAPPSGGGGEINTASNVGTGTGVFAQKSASDLQFKSLKKVGGALTIASDADSVTYTLDDAAFATSTQGTTADTALQPAAIGTTVQAYSAILDATTASYTTAAEGQIISNGVAVGELETDKVDSIPVISGADKIINMVSLTTAEYTGGTKVATTLYFITDAV